MAPYAFTVFLSAFLLFQVQTLLAKWLLPWYGGVPAVWTACLLFFQFALLLGYAYAHGIARLPARWQARVHLLAVFASLGALSATAILWGEPLLPADAWKPIGHEDPEWHLVSLLAVAVGLPFLALSATAPLVQHWYAREHGRPPYRLYALSNLGSLLGLLSHPFALEAFVPLGMQARAWALGFLAFGVGIGLLAWRSRRTGAVVAAPVSPEASSDPSPTGGQRFLWFALPACASVLLLAVTNQVSQEIAVVPLLWVLPLSLYLLSFILCFAGDHWYPRRFYLAALVPALALLTLTLQHSVDADLLSQVVLYPLGLFMACMVCHGELARLKPGPRHLTAFYLTLTAGGAAGGVFVGLVAPWLFPGYWELSLGLWACAALVVIALWRDRSSPVHDGPAASSYLTLFGAVLLTAFVFADHVQAWVQTKPALSPWGYGAVAGVGLVFFSVYALARWAPSAVGPASASADMRRWVRIHLPGRALAFGAALALFGGVHLVFMYASLDGPLAIARNFFGVTHVYAQADDDGTIWLKLRHGRTIHGAQRLTPDGASRPSGYYAPDSGIGQALTAHPLRRAGEPLRVGVVGLGTGTLATYGRQGDAFRFYEINPAVTRLSQPPGRVFTYLRDSQAAIDIVPGDARIALERERGRGLQRYDVLVLDAFNSGSIPAHLLTTEALALYLARLAPAHGVLALHISNRFLDLRPLVWGLAAEHGLTVAIVQRDDPDGESSSVWALLAKRAENLPVPASTLPAGLRAVLWRDDYTNLLPLIRLPAPERRAETPAALEAEATALDPAR